MDRGNRWQKGKSYHRYSYTILDISEATKRAPGTVRNDVSRGELDVEDLVSVANYVVRYRGAMDEKRP